MAQGPEMPKDTWSVTAEEKSEIRAFGRELHKFILEYAQKTAKNGRFHAKIMFGGFQYVADIQNQKSKMIGDDILVAKDTIERYGLNEALVEPFEDEPQAPVPQEETKEMKRARLQSELESVNRALETPEQRKARIEAEIAALDAEPVAESPAAPAQG